jgi:hypothetical protein
LVVLLFDLCFVSFSRAISEVVVLLSLVIIESNKMENTSGISEKTPSSTPSIDERDLVMSMRKLDLIKELGFVMNNKLQKK